MVLYGPDLVETQFVGQAHLFKGIFAIDLKDSASSSNCFTPCTVDEDKVLDLATLPASALEGREGLPGLDPRVVRAVGRRADGLFVVLDTDALLAPVLGA